MPRIRDPFVDQHKAGCVCLEQRDEGVTWVDPLLVGGRDQGDVWQIERPSSSDAHPTQKPLALVEKAISNSSSAGDLVCDFFLGSGTTAVVAKKLGRKYLGIDCSEEYCAMAKERLAGVSGNRQKKLAL